MAPIPRLRSYRGPAILSYGFRPFFLLGSLYAGLAILAWLPILHGELSVATAFAPRDWHVHEMLFGYVAAVVTGFLLTAIPNWTGRLPIQGMPLLLLVAAWLAGRMAVTFSASTGWMAAAAIDVAFLVLLAVAAGREIVAGRNWRNLKIVAVICVLAAANLAFHVEAHVHGVAEYSTRVGIAVVVLLITLIGGRIVPSFTHNWLVRARGGRLPAPFGRFDAAVIAASLVALTIWVVQPFSRASAAVLLVAGLMQIARLARWAGERAVGEPLVLILHVGYAFVPIGLLLAAAGAIGLVAESAGVHAWTAGAVGTMTLAVMTRASLGHTGRELTASAATQVIYAAVVIAALTRICAALTPEWGDLLLHITVVAWLVAFLGFGIRYAPILSAGRRSASQ